MKNDVIYRQSAINAIMSLYIRQPKIKNDNVYDMAIDQACDKVADLPSAQSELDEWCTDCKEYDHERHCCPRWNRVIRETLKDVERKPGRWEIRETADGDVEAKCSCCGFETLVNQPGNGLHMVNDLHFCPNCGADMRGE